MLSAEASAEPGRWRTERAAYQRGIMDAISDPLIHTVCVMSSAQVGKTEFLLNVIGYHVHQDAAPILLLQPTLEMAEAFSKDRLAPMCRDTPALHGRIKDPRSRDSGNTLLHKTFPGGHITMAGANSPASLASRPVRVVLCDEVDRYPASAGSEGDPVGLAAKRTATFWNRKLVLVSTPTVKGVSRIERGYSESDQRRYFVACPHCGVMDHLRWGNVVFGDSAPSTARYGCEHCGALWSNAERWKAIRTGEWRATATGAAGVVGFHLNELYSPWRKIEEITADFLSKKSNPESLKTFVNTSLGETWEEQGETLDNDVLYRRREHYPAAVPTGAVVLTAGVDVQDNRLEVEILGTGDGEESWGIAYHVLHGDPGRQALWDQLDELLDKTYQHESGVNLRVAAACVDSGGHHTQQVYKYCNARAARRVYAIKGQGGAGLPLVGRATKGNLQRCDLYPVGVDTAKGIVYGRLQIQEPGPGYCHFPITPIHDPEYFAQLTAEKRVTRYSKGFPKQEWIKTRPRNEALDCRVYAMAALAILNPNYKKIAAKLAPAEPAPVDDDAENETSQTPIPQRQTKPTKRRGGGFVRGWNGR